MRYRITTILKPGILDNAGKATTTALQSLGFDSVIDVAEVSIAWNNEFYRLHRKIFINPSLL